jgi:hypothetical protein
MPHEYHLTYSKKFDAEKPPMTGRTIRPSLSWVMHDYHKLVAWQMRVPSAEITDIKVTRRDYTEDDITPRLPDPATRTFSEN